MKLREGRSDSGLLTPEDAIRPIKSCPSPASRSDRDSCVHDPTMTWPGLGRGILKNRRAGTMEHGGHPDVEDAT